MFGHFLFKMRIINRKKNKCKLNLWVCLNQLPSSVVSALVRESVLVRVNGLKGTVHPKMKILSSFTHLQVVPNLYECLCSAEHKGRYFEESL